MRAWRFDRWTRIPRGMKSLRLALPWLALAAVAVLFTAAAVAQTKTAADSAKDDGSGIAVRVREDRTRSEVIERAREKVERVREQAERTASRTAATAVRAAQSVPEPPEPPEPPSFDHSDGNDLVRFGEDIEISEGRVIDGDVVAIGGSVTVLGRVRGDCVAVGGTVSVKGKGVVEGDAVSLGGGVSTSDSASIGGSDVSVGKVDFGHMGKVWPAMTATGVLGGGLWMVKTLVGLLITLFLAWVSLLLVRDRIERAATTVNQRFGKSFLMGLLGWVMLVLAVPVGVVALVVAGVIAIVILCITIIGIPVAVLLAIGLVIAIVALIVGVIYAGFLGYLAGAMYLGRRLFGDRVAAKPLYAIAAGVVLIVLLDFVGDLVGTASFFIFHPVGMAFGFAAALLCFLAATAGLGGLMAGGFGRVTIIAADPATGAYQQWGSGPPPPTSESGMPGTPPPPSPPPVGGAPGAP
jgi:hypothetical protein